MSGVCYRQDVIVSRFDDADAQDKYLIVHLIIIIITMGVTVIVAAPFSIVNCLCFHYNDSYKLN